MQPVSSVTAFLARYLCGPDINPEVREVLAALDPIDRRIVEEYARTPAADERRRRLAEQTGEVWEPVQYDRAEARALSRLQRELNRRGWVRA